MRGKSDKQKSKPQHNWKKKSIFFKLPYWKDNLIHHNLDVMHIEKNICDNVLWTLLSVDGKGKDNLNARLKDLQHIGIRKALHTQHHNNRTYLPPACFTLDNYEKCIICKLLKNVKVPDGYASNISRCVNIKQHTLFGLKSHDSHILMQQLLPLAIRRLYPPNVAKPLIEFSSFFGQICSKVLNEKDLDHLQSQIEHTLCHLEMIFHHHSLT